LQHWETFFSKHWDTCCSWGFKNKHKLYGSICFESVLMAGDDREKRLDYFREVVEELKGYEERDETQKNQNESKCNEDKAISK